MNPITKHIEAQLEKHRCDCEDQPCHVAKMTIEEYRQALENTALKVLEIERNNADARGEPTGYWDEQITTLRTSLLPDPKNNET